MNRFIALSFLVLATLVIATNGGLILQPETDFQTTTRSTTTVASTTFTTTTQTTQRPSTTTTGAINQIITQTSESGKLLKVICNNCYDIRINI